MNQMGNDINNILSSLTSTASQMGDFLSKVQEHLTPEQKELLNKELGGDGAFGTQMKKTQDDLAKMMNDLNKIK